MKKKLLKIVVGMLLAITLFSNSVHAEDKNTVDYLIEFSKLSSGSKYTLDTLMEKYEENMIEAQKNDIAIELDKAEIEKIDRVLRESIKRIDDLSDARDDLGLRFNNFARAQEETTQLLIDLEDELNNYVGDKDTEEYKALEKEVQETRRDLIYLLRVVVETEEGVKILDKQIEDLEKVNDKQKPDMLFQQEIAMFSSKYTDDIKKNVIEIGLDKFNNQVLELIPLIIRKESIEDNAELLTIIYEKQKTAMCLGYVSEETVLAIKESLKSLNDELNTIYTEIEKMKNSIRIQADLKRDCSIQLCINLNDINPIYSINYYLNDFEKNSIYYKQLDYTKTAYDNLIKNYRKYGSLYAEQTETAQLKFQKVELEEKELMNTIELSIQGTLDGIKKTEVQIEGLLTSIEFKEKELEKLRLKEKLGFVNSMEVLNKEYEVKGLKSNYKIYQFQLYMYHKKLESYQRGIY